MPGNLQFDVIGLWSEIKLAILNEYASAYSGILAAQKSPPLHHVYIDGFAGAGVHISKATETEVPGSPQIALNVEPPFKEFHWIDLNPAKASNLRYLAESRPEVRVYEGDCNQILLNDVFPRVRYEDYRRGLCILDPYGLHLDWNVIRTAGEMGTIDMFLNFPVADMNRNVFWRDPSGVDLSDIKRMNMFWGDESWKAVAYTTEWTLFGTPEKESNKVIASAFKDRLRTKAGFRRVPDPMPMRNSRGAVVYYLFFASQKNTAENIVTDIFRKYAT